MLHGNIIGSGIGKYQVKMAEARISHRECKRGMHDACTSDGISEVGICLLKIVLKAENTPVT